MTTTFEKRQQELKTLNDNIAKQTAAYKTAPKFDAAASKTTIDTQVSNNHKAVETKIGEDHSSIVALSGENKALTIENAKLSQLIEVKAVEAKFEVCKAQNDLANLVNPNLDPAKYLPVADCKADHCDAFNSAVQAYNNDNNDEILAGNVAAHESANCA